MNQCTTIAAAVSFFTSLRNTSARVADSPIRWKACYSSHNKGVWRVCKSTEHLTSIPCYCARGCHPYLTVKPTTSSMEGSSVVVISMPVGLRFHPFHPNTANKVARFFGIAEWVADHSDNDKPHLPLDDPTHLPDLLNPPMLGMRSWYCIARSMADFVTVVIPSLNHKVMRKAGWLWRFFILYASLYIALSGMQSSSRREVVGKFFIYLFCHCAREEFLDQS